MAETRVHAVIDKETDSETHGIIEFNGVAEAAGRVHVTIELDESLDTENHEITITNN
jgi:hypothetical protein